MGKKHIKRGSLKALLKRHNEDDQKRKNLLKKKGNVESLERLKKDKITGNKYNREQQNQSMIVPFETTKDVLFLIGEGDFSYTRSLIESNYHEKPSNIIATSFDNSVEECSLKYPTTFKENHDFLVEKEVKIIFGVDARNLVKSLKISKRTGVNKVLNVEKIDCMIFNFPHTGSGVKDMDRNVLQHQKLLDSFFGSAKELVGLFDAYANNKCTDSYAQSYKAVTNRNVVENKNCRLAVSLFKGLPYDNWQLKRLANTNEWKTLTTFKFDWAQFKTYQHRRTNSEMSTTKNFAEREARVHLFDRIGVVKKQQPDKGNDSGSDYE